MALTIDEFVSVARESRLLKPDLLDSMLGEVGATGSIHDSHALASRLVGQGALTHWQSEKLLGGVSSGFFLGKYKLQRLIASGSMSSVYEAEHTLLRKRVALKVLPKSLVKEASFLERFYREARAVVRLDHPNIIRGYDVGQEGDYHYFVMEYLEGMSFQDLIEQSGPLSADVAAGMIRQAALGLQHAHEAGMVHRDIKPANLLLDQDGVVKVLDLGLVRSRPQENDGEAGLTRIHDERMLGTVDYLSPEQAIDSHNVDIRSDIYSLGCTFYFLLAGDPPFAKGTLPERLLAHQTRSPIPISVIRPDVPASLGRIMGKMLEKRPDARYQTPAEVAQGLEEWIHRPAEPVHVSVGESPTTLPWFTPAKREEAGIFDGFAAPSSIISASATRVISSAPRLSAIVRDDQSSRLSAIVREEQPSRLSAIVRDEQPSRLSAIVREEQPSRMSAIVRDEAAARKSSIVRDEQASRNSAIIRDEPTPIKSSKSIVVEKKTLISSDSDSPVVVRRRLWEPWNLWVKAVEALASNAPIRSTPSEDVYREIYEDLMLACREIPEDAGDGTRKLVRKIHDLTAPWMNVQALRSILQSEMKLSIMIGVRELDKYIIACRDADCDSGYGSSPIVKFLAFALAASVIGAAFVFLGPEPTDSEISQSWVAQARHNLKRQVISISEKLASH